MSKLLTVFGSTGNQGGSVIDAVLADPELKKKFRIRGVTRDVSKPAAQALKKKGVEVVAANMDSPASVATAVHGAHTVFLVTDFWSTQSMDIEYTQGRNVADAAQASNVSHLIYSSLIHVTEVTAGRLEHVSHFVGKALVERYIRELEIPSSFVQPGYFMSNFLQSLQKQNDGSYVLALPVTKWAGFPLFDVNSDTGKFVVATIKHRDSLLGAQVHAATDYYRPHRIVEEFTEVTGHPAKFVSLRPEEFLKVLPAAVGQEMLENHQLLEGPGYYAGASLKPSLELLGGQKPTTWKEFVARTDAWK